MPRRWKIFSWRYSGRPSTYFDVATCAKSDGVAMLLGTGSFGIGAIRTPCLQVEHAYFGRMWRTISTVAGMNFSWSDCSRPISTSR